MNVISDILCDTSSLMAPQSFNETLPQNKILSHDMSSKQGPLILDSVSQISNLNRPLSSVNHSSPADINIFNTTNQIHIPSNIDSGFEDRNSISVFPDSFPEIVPSWLAHDFMKVSDNLASPSILSTVSDIYTANRENEHLEMLDLGFTSELTSHDVSNNINRPCIDDSQKLLGNLPMQRFPNTEPLMIPFNLNNPHMHISMDKNTMQYGKFKHNEPDVNSAQSLMNTVLPTENNLLHLPLPSNLSEQCLNSTSSPSMISNSQSQSHPVDVVCDKLPQINLNHLDSLLVNEATLSDIQLLRHDFPNVRLNEDGCNAHSNRTCLDNYHPNSGIISCGTNNILGPTVSSLSQSQDVSVQVSANAVSEHNLPHNINCYSCNEVPPGSPIEIVQCFKCKFCDFISIHKCTVANHINVMHSKPPDNISINKNIPHNIRSDNFNSLSIGGQGETRLNNNTVISSNMSPVLNSNINNTSVISEMNINSNNDKFPCMQCNGMFDNIEEYNTHLLSNHNNKTNVQLNLINSTNTINYQHIPVNNIVKNDSSQKYINIIINGVSSVPQNNPPKTSMRKIFPDKTPQYDPPKNPKRNTNPKKDDETQKKDQGPRKALNEVYAAGNEKNISSHKRAWKKKMSRELGSYICESKGCNVRFRALDNLEYHRKCHISDKNTFQCPECRMDFDNWGAIAGHLWRNHNNDMELHACDKCPFRTYSLGRLENIHKKIHNDECLFLCDTCGKGFKNGKQLRSHRVIHLSLSKKRAGDHKCNVCSRSFGRKSLLFVHQNTVHNKIKPFVCNFCDYSASKKSTMNLHMRQHTGEKPFKCNMCEFKTSDHNTLRRHKMTHSGEKQYKCPYCSYSTIQAHVYKTHLDNKHPAKDDGFLFSCNICSFKTLNQSVYLMHMSEHNARNKSPNESTMTDMQTTDELLPLAEAMDINLSESDNLLSNLNKNKITSHFFNELNVNMVYVGQQSAE